MQYLPPNSSNASRYLLLSPSLSLPNCILLVCKIVLHQVSRVSATCRQEKKSMKGGRMGGLFESALPSPCLIQHVWDALSFHRTRNEWRRSVNVVLVSLLHPFQPLTARPPPLQEVPSRWRIVESFTRIGLSRRPVFYASFLRRLTAE